jgi:hypothetical protein
VEGLEKALQKAERSGRPVLWYMLKWPETATLGTGDYDLYMRVTVFHEPSTVSLLNDRFVCCREQPMTGSALRNARSGKVDSNLQKESAQKAKQVGMDKFGVCEPALVFLTSDGKLLHVFDRINLFHEDLFNHVLREVLRLQGEDGREGKRTNGEGSEDSNRSELRTSLLRRYLRMDDWDRAEEQALQIQKEGTGPHVAEARIRLADIAWLRKEEGKALALWEEVVRGFPESPFAAEAAVALLGKHPLQYGMEELRALPGRWFEGLPAHTHERIVEAEIGTFVRQGVENLLRWQRSDGRWTDIPYCPMNMKPERRLNVQYAVTALSALALWEWRALSPGKIASALSQAEAVLRDHGHLAKTPYEKVYAYAHALLYWARLAQEKGGARRKEACQEAGRLLDKLSAVQSGGGWGTYLGTFTTAYVLMALAEAKTAGIEIPDGIAERGRDALIAVRSKSGSYPYSCSISQRLSRASDEKKSDTQGSSARDALCELACYLHGGSDEERLGQSVGGFIEQLGIFERVRYTDFHVPDQYNNGGFMFFHNFYPATEAVLRLSEGTQRERFRKALLSAILGYPEAGGAFVNSPNLGKTYSTALGLLSLKNLLDS